MIDVQNFLFDRVTKELIKELNGDCVLNFEFIKCDLSQKAEIDSVWEQIVSKYGRIHILVNNAGMARIKLFKDLSFDEFEKVIKVNFLAYVKMTKLFLE